jgi:hypothetical protein
MLEGVHQAAARCESSVGLAQRTMYASAALPSFTTLATPVQHALVCVGGAELFEMWLEIES